MPHVRCRRPSLRRGCIVLGLAALACLATTAAWAIPLETLGVQGRVLTATGQPVPDGNYKVTIRFYAGQADALAAALFTEVQLAVPVKNGLFSLQAGSVQAIPPSLLQAGAAAWVGLQIAAEAELPRSPLKFVPYASRAQTAAALACSGCVTTAMIDAAVFTPYATKASVAGLLTAVSGTAPIAATTSGTAVTVALTGVVPVANGGTGNATGTASAFSGNLAGDVSGAQGSTVVGKIRGRAVAATAPADGQVLTYNVAASSWGPAAPTGGSSSTSGSGSAGYGARWTSASGLGNSLVYDNGTNVGIGTTTPQATLHIEGDLRGKAALAGAINVQTTSGSMQFGAQNASWAHIETDRPSFYFNKGITVDTGLISSYSQNLSLQTSGTTRVTIVNSNGNVGIGTATPGTRLEVAGSIRGNVAGALRVDSGNGYVDIGPQNATWAHFSTDRSKFWFNAGVTLGTGVLSSHASTDLSLQTNDTTRMFLQNSTGNVGINTTGPGERLDVAGNIKASGSIYTPGTLYWGDSGFRTEYQDDAGLQAGRSGFFQTSAPAPAANWYPGASSWQHLLSVHHTNPANNFAMQFAGNFSDQNLWFRKTNNNPAQAWARVLTTNDTAITSPAAGNASSGWVDVGVGWYRIAVNGTTGTDNTGNRADANFTLRDLISGGGHSTVRFALGSNFNDRASQSFTMLNHSSYNGATFTQVRVLTASTYFGQAVEVYVARPGTVGFTISDNNQQNGWAPVAWTPGAVPGGYAVSTYDIDKLFVVGDGASQFTVNRGGNTGIGTSSPAQKLDVSGNIRATGALFANANGAAYLCGGDDACLYDVNLANTVGVYGAQNSAVATLRLGSGGADISGSGSNVGIGTLTPAFKLDVNGTLRAADYISTPRVQSFKILGNINYFYPVVFNDYHWNDGAYELEISRANVHADSDWQGSTMSRFRGHDSGCGHGSDFLDVDIRQAVTAYIGGYGKVPGCNGNYLVIWLKGQSTYWMRGNHFPNLPSFNSSDGGLVQDGQTLAIKTSVDGYVLGSGQTYGNNFRVLGDAAINGSLGVGTYSPTQKLDVSGNIRATGAVYANANGSAYLCGGDDACLNDVNVANTVGIFGVQNSAVGTLRLGNSAADISGSGGNIGIGTASPTEKLHVNGALVTQNGQVKRDFITWNTTTSTSLPVHIKTNIHIQTNIMYRILVEGYNYGQGTVINADACGYTYAGWSCIGQNSVNNYASGVSISQYCSADGYVVIKLNISSSYYMGFSASAWLTNPTGQSFNISAVVTQQGANL